MLIIMAVAMILAPCGGSSDVYPDDVVSNTNPIVSRVDPATAARSQEITIYGIGFSIEPPSNIVIIGNSSTSATAHGFIESPTSTEFEYITATIPADTPEGDNSVIVQVHEYSSNTDITIAVTP